MKPVNTKQILELSSKLFGRVVWDNFSAEEIQKLIDSSRLSAVHFEEFIRQGGRMSLEAAPIKVLKSWTITFGPDCTWEDAVRTAKEDVGGNSNILSGFYDGMVLTDTILKPKNFTMRSKVKVHMFEVTEKEGVSSSRMLELLELSNMYPSTIPEVFAVLNSFAPKLPKDTVLINASKNEIHQDVKNMLISQKGLGQYEFSVIGGDIEDSGYWCGHLHYFATSYD